MERKKLDLTIPTIGKVLNVVAILGLLFSIVYLVMNWGALPDQVPKHYNASGEVDAWGSKGFIVFPLILGILLWLGVSLIEKKPHLHNYLNLTEKTIEQQYRNSMLLMNFVKNEILLFFSFGVWKDVQISMGKTVPYSSLEFPIFLGVIFLTIIIFVVRSFTLAKK